MMKFKEFLITDLFDPVRGKSVYTRHYAKENAGSFPIYSAGRGTPLGFINSFDHDGVFLSWTTNGYAGYVQILEGKFSINSDRGLLIPLDIKNLSLDYCRLILQPKLRSQAVGRIIDGKKNEYTKLSPTVVSETTITIPVDKKGIPDKNAQEKLVSKYLKIENFQNEFEDIYDRLLNSSMPVTFSNSVKTISIANNEFFSLQIGNRILKKDIQVSGIPVYSANVNEPFGHITESSLEDFSLPALLWGIDGTFDWNIIPANTPFAPTDHCGVLNIKSEDLDPEYIYFALKGSKDQYGFDRTFRASLENMKEVVTINVPTTSEGKFDLQEQRRIAQQHKKIKGLKSNIINQLDILISSPISFE